MKNLVFTCMVLLSALAASAQDADLKLKLEKNKIYRFKSLSEQNVSQTVNGMEQTTTTSSNTAFSIKMIDATADFIIAEVRFDTLITKSNAMGKISDISSAVEGNIASEEAADVMSYIMNRISRNALYVKMDGTGKVIDIVNHSMMSDIVLKDTAAVTGQMAPILKTQIKNTVSKEALTSMIESFTHNLPGKPVQKGGQWSVSTPFNAGGMTLDINTSYKLETIKDYDAGITAESVIKTAVNAKPMEYSGAKITYDGLGGMGKSDMMINTLTGLVITSNAKFTITGDLNVSVQGMSMQIPMNIESTSTTSLIQ